MKIPKNVLKEMGYIQDVDLFTAVVLVNYLTKEKQKEMSGAIVIASNYYNVKKGAIIKWLEKLENAFDTIQQSSEARSVENDSAESSEWEQKMTELEAVLL